jgi:hypothetical protein
MNSNTRVNGTSVSAGRRRWQSVLMATVVAVGLCSLGGAPADATSTAATGARRSVGSVAGRPALPADWTLTPGKGRDRLTWRAPKPVHGDARVEFFVGKRSLGTPIPTADGRSFHLDVPAGSTGDSAELRVVAGGRRLDAAGVAALKRLRAGGPKHAAPRPVQAPAAVDPGRPGTFSTLTGEYSLPNVKLPDYPEPVEMRARVVAPKGAVGRRPIALFLHGRHSTCYAGAVDLELIWPCPPGAESVPSYRGYLKAQHLLASQGYVTVSISANGINGQDTVLPDIGTGGRSALIRLHLGHWADWAGEGRAAAPNIVRAAPVADLSEVLLIGHSRGGDGVNRAAIDSLTPPPSKDDGFHGPVRWKIRGTVQLAPTSVGHNPAADVPSVVVLSGCDGDVYDLQGQQTVDATRGVGSGTALHSALFVVGANHNYYSSEWTPGLAQGPATDDWFDPDDAVCGTTSDTSVRLTPQQQQQVGATYIAAAAQVFVRGDDRALPLLDGSGVRAPSVAPADVRSHAVGAARRALVRPAADLSVSGPDARLCRQVAKDSSSCLSLDNFGEIIPSFVSLFGIWDDPDRYAVDLSWSTADSRGATLKPARAASLADSQSVALRMIVPKNAPATDFDVQVADTAGHRARLGTVTLTGLPGTEQTVGSWTQEVRVSLSAARQAGLNLNRIAELTVIPRSSSGRAYLVDAWGWQPGTPAVRIVTRTRVDISGHLSVDESDSVVTYRMPVSFSGARSGRVKVTTADFNNAETLSTTLVRIRPGMRELKIPVAVDGDELFSYGRRYVVIAESIHGTTIGSHQGIVDVTDDDPAPKLTVTPVSDRVSEGGSLRWRITMSAPAATSIDLRGSFLPPTVDPELSTTDVPAEWVENELLIDPLPGRPLSAGEGNVWVSFPGGSTEAEVTVPTLKDDLVEGAEQIRLALRTSNGSGVPEPVELTGTVVD